MWAENVFFTFYSRRKITHNSTNLIVSSCHSCCITHLQHHSKEHLCWYNNHNYGYGCNASTGYEDLVSFRMHHCWIHSALYLSCLQVLRQWRDPQLHFQGYYYNSLPNEGELRPLSKVKVSFVLSSSFGFRSGLTDEVKCVNSHGLFYIYCFILCGVAMMAHRFVAGNDGFPQEIIMHFSEL